MKDGLYIVYHGTITAGFVVREGEVTTCAPVLKKKLDYWKRVAKWIPTNLDLPPLAMPEEVLP